MSYRKLWSNIFVILVFHIMIFLITILLLQVLHLVEQLCLALNDEFRMYLLHILPSCIQVLGDAERCNDYYYVPGILHTLEVFGGLYPAPTCFHGHNGCLVNFNIFELNGTFQEIWMSTCTWLLQCLFVYLKWSLLTLDGMPLSLWLSLYLRCRLVDVLIQFDISI